MTATGRDLVHVNDLIAQFDEQIKVTARAEKRDALKSVMFDVPRRSVLGWRVLYEVEGEILERLLEHTTPEGVGRGMRRLGSRPYALQVFFLVAGYLLTRQQDLLDRGVSSLTPWRDERSEELAFIMESWERISRAYRGDGYLLPGQTDGSLRILDQETLDAVRQAAMPATDELYGEVRRAVATLELCSFVLHGEQRDGIGGHGPYHLEDGRVMFFRELTDLRNEYMPWARTERRNLFDNVVIAYVVSGDVSVTCDMFGSTVVRPLDFHDRVEEVAVLTATESGFTVIEPAQLPEIEEAAVACQQELYLKAMEWDERYKIEYAGPLYANHLNPFFLQAGVDGQASELIMRRCCEAAEAHVDELLGANPTIWGHLAGFEGPIFSPIAEE